MGKYQDQYNKYLENRQAVIDSLVESNARAGLNAREKFEASLVKADEVFSGAIKKLEDEGIELSALAMQEIEEETKLLETEELSKKTQAELDAMTEAEVVAYAKSLGITAKISDKKASTVAKILLS